MAGEVITYPDGRKYRLGEDGEWRQVIDLWGDIPEEGRGGSKDGQNVGGSDGETSSPPNWLPGAFGKASWVPGNANFRPCEWLYDKTGIKCWWIIAAAAAYLTVRAVMNGGGRRRR